jgi:5-methyltetrahydropteroyltriglutamate--homocysteine methyltransferase
VFSCRSSASASSSTASFDSGPNREIKKAVEAYWGGKLSAEELTKVAAEVRKGSWTAVKARGVDFIPR